MNRCIIFLIAILLVPTVVRAEITRTLKLGDRGVDVRELQAFLNKDPDTMIAPTGVGSPGNESTYFGTRTLLAVKKFQTKYAYQTLTPAGLSAATGTVGYYTRALIYKMTRATTTTSFLPTGISAEKPPTVTSITPATITTFPQTVTIVGTGFTTNTVALFSSEQEGGITGTVSPDGTTLTVSFAYAGARKARAQLARYQSTPKYDAIKQAFLSGITNVNSSSIPVVVVVKNSAGESAARSISVNLAAML